MFALRGCQGDQVPALRGVAPMRSSAARAALDLIGAEDVVANTCQP